MVKVFYIFGHAHLCLKIQVRCESFLVGVEKKIIREIIYFRLEHLTPPPIVGVGHIIRLNKIVATVSIATLLVGQFSLQHFINLCRVCFPFWGFHDLANEEAEDLFFTAAVLFYLGGIVSDDFVYKGFYSTGVGDLFEAFVFDDAVGIFAFLVPECLEDLLGDFTWDGVVANTD